jgi:hypothetical protein
MFTAMHYAPIRRVRDVPVLPVGIVGFGCRTLALFKSTSFAFSSSYDFGGGHPCGVALCKRGLGSNFAMSAENDLSKEADHACFFERERPAMKARTVLVRNRPPLKAAATTTTKKNASAGKPAFPGYANANAAYAKIDSSAG